MIYKDIYEEIAVTASAVTAEDRGWKITHTDGVNQQILKDLRNFSRFSTDTIDIDDLYSLKGVLVEWLVAVFCKTKRRSQKTLLVDIRSTMKETTGGWNKPLFSVADRRFTVTVNRESFAQEEWVNVLKDAVDDISLLERDRNSAVSLTVASELERVCKHPMVDPCVNVDRINDIAYCGTELMQCVVLIALDQQKAVDAVQLSEDCTTLQEVWDQAIEHGWFDGVPTDLKEAAKYADKVVKDKKSTTKESRTAPNSLNEALACINRPVDSEEPSAGEHDGNTDVHELDTNQRQEPSERLTRLISVLKRITPCKNDIKMTFEHYGDSNSNKDVFVVSQDVQFMMDDIRSEVGGTDAVVNDPVLELREVNPNGILSEDFTSILESVDHKGPGVPGTIQGRVSYLIK